MALFGNYESFYQQILHSIPKQRVFTDPLYTLAYGTDASFYRLIPKIVIWAENGDEIKRIIKLANSFNLPIVFRAAGTSLSGQAISDSILVVTSRDWNSIFISNDEKTITLAPSVIGHKANEALKIYQKKIGPDPASIKSAMIGGIVANNASGMCCGVDDNSYKTLQDMKIIFADGSRLDTSSKASKEQFAKTHKSFLNTLTTLAQKVKNNPKLKALIEKKFSIKNTCGYGLNALVDFKEPYEIIKHLMVGSEGTLGFIEDVTLQTIPNYPHRASALIVFRTLQEACEGVMQLKLTCKEDVSAAELMDRSALRSVANQPKMPKFLQTLSKDATALLVEVTAKSDEALSSKIDNLTHLFDNYKLETPLNFTKKEEEYALFWKIRKGLFPAVGSVREVGATVIIEDIAYPMESFAKGIKELRELLKKHGYENAIIFGHALDGNIHFVFTQKFETARQIEQYGQFMDELALHVTEDFIGSLKAEHGTGRNMAPYVAKEWGKEAYEIMCEIKHIFDPKGLLNPGVIITKDPKAHLKNLKILPKTNPQIDMCIECGFCEDICPSNALTFTPRQRIVANRHISYLKEQGKQKEAQNFKYDYVYPGLETCATCSLCVLGCPVAIDMGKMTKWLREQENSKLSNHIASFASEHYKPILDVSSVALSGLHTISHIKPKISKKAALNLRKMSKSIPLWSESLPKGAKTLKKPINSNITSEKKAVYFTSCINQTLGNPKPKKHENSLHVTMQNILIKAGYEVIIPKYSKELCCGLPFFSKGYKVQGLKKQNELYRALLVASKNGKYPIVCDMSPCTKTILENLPKDLQVFDGAQFVYEVLKDDLEFAKTDESVLLHVTCSSKMMENASSLLNLAHLCSHNVIVPKDITCCGFAGDRGFTVPKLNQSALRNLKQAIPRDVKLAFSTSKTCEIGLSQESGLAYRSILYLVDSCTQPKNRAEKILNVYK